MRRVIFFKLSLLLISASLLAGCSTALSALKADPAPDSGFLSRTITVGQQRENHPFHRVWEAAHGSSSEGKKFKLYIAPVDTSHLSSNAWWYSSEDAAIEAVKDEAGELAEYTRSAFEKEIAGRPEVEFVEENQATHVLRLAIVELSPTDVFRNILGAGLSTLVPGGGLVSAASSGSIAIEGMLIDQTAGEPKFMFADREKGKIALFSFNDFTYFSHARVAVDDWAEQFTRICIAAEGEQVADSFPVTMLPI